MGDTLISALLQVPDNRSLVYESGYMKPLVNCTLEDKQDIIKVVFLHLTIYRYMAEWEQLWEGLNVMGVCKKMATNRHGLQGFFTTMNKKPLTASMDVTHTSCKNIAAFRIVKSKVETSVSCIMLLKKLTNSFLGFNAHLAFKS